jgi:hypothetical protein
VAPDLAYYTVVAQGLTSNSAMPTIA